MWDGRMQLNVIPQDMSIVQGSQSFSYSLGLYEYENSISKITFLHNVEIVVVDFLTFFGPFLPKKSVYKNDIRLSFSLCLTLFAKKCRLI